MRGNRYPVTPTIAVDVDGTLLVNGRPNGRLVQWIRERRAQGYHILLWSARGERYARTAAQRLGVESLFHTITSKPGYIVDDLGRYWTRYMHVVKRMTDDLPDATSDDRSLSPDC